jgi:4-amino-4-deoxy-L-arabinose transferase-like glycosyltransferase
MWVLFLLVPALYINLGMLPLGGDESIRALVSMEMMISGDYITPTLNGELYFNKPPLFNWLLIFFFKVFNSESEFICRLPTTIFLIVYCFTIFWWVKKHFGYSSGIMAALMFFTCGRILFRDSFLGLIDMTYSWLIFLNFMFIWYYFEKKNFLALFLVSYVITAVTFLLKGLPSVAFQGITLLVLFISERQEGRYK